MIVGKMLQEIILLLLIDPWILFLVAIPIAFFITHFSNEDSILQIKDFLLIWILYSLTIAIILFGFLIFLAISYFPSIQKDLVNTFTALGVVLSFFAIALSIGYSTDNSVFFKRLQKEITEIKKCIKKEGITLQAEIKKEGEHNSLQLQNLYQKYNQRYLEEIEQNKQQLEDLLQNQNFEFKVAIENNNQKLQDRINNSNNYLESVIENKNLIIEQLIKKNNQNIEDIKINLLELKELSREDENLSKTSD